MIMNGAPGGEGERGGGTFCSPWCYCREVRVFHWLLIMWDSAYWFATRHQSSANPPAWNTDTILIMMCFNIRFRFSEGFENMVIFMVLHFFMNTSQDLVLNSASDLDMCPKEMLNTRPSWLGWPPDLLASNYHNECLAHSATGTGRSMQKGFIDVILSFLWRIFITVAHHLLLFIPGPLTTHPCFCIKYSNSQDDIFLSLPESGQTRECVIRVTGGVGRLSGNIQSTHNNWWWPRQDANNLEMEMSDNWEHWVHQNLKRRCQSGWMFLEISKLLSFPYRI